MKSRAASRPATARCWSSTRPRVSKRRAWRTATPRSSRGSKWCRCSTRSTCLRPTPTRSSRKSRRSSASMPPMRCAFRPRPARTCPSCSKNSSRRFPAPKGDPAAPLQALIIDSWFDNYVGVVSLVRVMNGTLRTGEKIRVMSTGRSHISRQAGPVHAEVGGAAAARGRRGGLRHRRHQGDRRRAGRRHDHHRECAAATRRCPDSSRCSRACLPACSR